MLTFNNEKLKGALRCPICKAEMDISENGSATLFCKGAKKHCYDFASGGYVNLCRPGQSGGGDSKQAVRARSDFLDLDYYAPVRDKLCELLCGLLDTQKQPIIIDAGCGEGYYSTAIAKRGFALAGFDLSKFATDAAAKRAKHEAMIKTKRSNEYFFITNLRTVGISIFSIAQSRTFRNRLATNSFLWYITSN